ncbi:ImmA/IrrE family metallo-endopeptidase [Candidatus Francisella endociliophora]|uniref:ImmA/IrrE family metallo-endopeptidase n=1 Tax=Candidatus Francisella endociliophora TaxID=653937 RepID=UPI000693488C|nr:ImmA/IrrE family metallo-endopeptidase [Francisella sp. FSC1006]
MTNEEVRIKANDIYREHTLKTPIQLVKLANELGYEVKVSNLSNMDKDEINTVSGAILYDDKTILIDSRQNPNRQRFTLAHEIGHLVLNHRGDENYSIDYRIDGQSARKEVEANIFASELLAPKNEVLKWAEKNKSNDGYVWLAKFVSDFEMSYQAAEIRLEILGISYV